MSTRDKILGIINYRLKEKTETESENGIRKQKTKKQSTGKTRY